MATKKKTAARTPRTRTETDSMGAMDVPADVLYGATTQRAVLNFPIAHRPVGWEVIHAFTLLKRSAAQANRSLGKLDTRRSRLIEKACDEVVAMLDDPDSRGDMMRHFPVDVFQTGSGTSTNMNVNEVVSNIACVGAGSKIGAQDPIHPNDHVNMGQSSNDTFPTAMQIAAADHIKRSLIPALKTLHRSLKRKAKAFDKIVKIGRTHLQDATPIRLGQEFSGYAAQAEYCIERANSALESLAGNLPIGGTAVGTGINTHPKFGRLVASALSKATGVRFKEAPNHFEAQATRDCVCEAHGQLRTIAISMSKIASDIRFMGCGPRCGIHELELPAIQPGSSIMPGKVNPVLVESVMQVAMKVSGNDVAVGMGNLGGAGSMMELSLAMPMMADVLLESITIIGNVAALFATDCVDGLKANRKEIAATVERSLMLGTALAPVLGYNEAAHIAKASYKEGCTIREYCLENNILPAKELDELLDVTSMTHPH
ncbi:MAG: class II fumarate hydratase [Phycisphaerales bacterium]|nr:class II fumarate hydratase [Phycisphaerales bacterium]